MNSINQTSGDGRSSADRLPGMLVLAGVLLTSGPALHGHSELAIHEAAPPLPAPGFPGPPGTGLRSAPERPLLEPVLNQVITEGIPVRRVRWLEADPGGGVRLEAVTADGNRTVRVNILRDGGPVLLELIPVVRNLATPARTTVTLTAVLQGASQTTHFVVIVHPRDFSPIEPRRSPGPAGWSLPQVPRFPPLPLAAAAHRFFWVDVTLDGYPDLATGVDGAVTMNPFARSFSGTQPISRADPGTLQVMAWGDMDGDGVPDAFVSGPRLMGTFRTRGNRVTPFFDRVTNHLEGIAVQGASWADLDGNGTLDLVYSGVAADESRRVVVALNDGSGTLTMVSHNLPPAGGPIVAADFNQDGRPDLVLFSRSNPGGNPRVQFNRGGGVFEAGPVVPALHPVTAAGALDINGDGVTDLWLVEEPQGDPRQRALRVLLQRAGQFVESYRVGARDFATAAAPAWGDMDHDGWPDFVAPYEDRVLQAFGRETTTNHFAVYHNRGEGRFERGRFLFAGPPPSSTASASFVPVAADANLDGALDIVGYEDGFRIFFNHQRQPNLPPDAPSGLRAFAMGDEVLMFWNVARDPNQTTPLTYNVRAGSSPGAHDLVPAQSLPDGTRLLPQAGNAGYLLTFQFRLPRPDINHVFWSVQAVDASLSGGPFAPELSLAVGRPDNRPPGIVAPTVFVLTEDTAGYFDIEVSDDLTPAGAIEVRVETDRGELFARPPAVQRPPTDEDGSVRRVTLIPARNASGNATLTIVAVDRNGAEARRQVTVLVLEDNDRPTITAQVAGPQYLGRPIFGVVWVGDVETPPDALRITARSSNPSLVPDGQIVVSGAGAGRSLRVVPLRPEPGRVVITLTVTDADGLSDSVDLILLWQAQLLDPERLVGPISGLTSPQWVDFDADGRLDLVGVGPGSTSEVSVWRREEDGTWSEALRHATGMPIGSLHLWDFDGDGDVDLLVAAQPGSVGADGVTMVVLVNEGGRIGQSVRLRSVDSFQTLAIFDADADGDPDIVAARSGTELELWRHPGGPLLGDASGHWSPMPLVNPRSLTAGITGSSSMEGLLPADLDGDGRLDLIVTRDASAASSRSRWLRQQPDGQFIVEPPRWVPTSRALGWTDFSNDGVPDLLVEFPLDTGVRVNRLYPDGAGSVDFLVGFGLGPLGDLDGDGFEDLLVTFRGARDGSLVSNLTRTPYRVLPQIESLARFTSLLPADVSADGRLELLGVSPDGLELVRNLGAPSNSPPSVPTGLRMERLDDDTVELVWTAARDREQAGGLSYCVRMGTSPGGHDVVPAVARADGIALIPGRGNAGWRGRFLIAGLRAGETYHWSVQAVDSGFARSAFAPEVSFTLNARPTISGLADVVLSVGAGPQELAFQVADLETPSEALEVTVASSNPVLLPASRVQITGSGADRRVVFELKPDRAGTADVTVRVTDADAQVTDRSFTVFVPSPDGWATRVVRTLEVPAGGELPFVLSEFDPEGDFQSYRISLRPRHGRLIVDPDGTRVRYQPDTGFLGQDMLEFVASTPGSWNAWGQVRLQVVPAHRLHPELRLGSFGMPSRLRLVLRAREGVTIRLEHSRDLRDWQSLGELRMPQDEALLVDPPAPSDVLPQFFRLLRIDD